MWPCDGNAPQNTGDLQIYSNYSTQVWPTPKWVQNFNFEALKVLKAKKKKIPDTHLLSVFFAFAYHGDDQPHTYWQAHEISAPPQA